MTITSFPRIDLTSLLTLPVHLLRGNSHSREAFVMPISSEPITKASILPFANLAVMKYEFPITLLSG
ncbi:MAG UNVERIFIED_CONTAM: hypothetical protein LVQ98_03505 [Rickettsiaceae bacterium]